MTQADHLGGGAPVNSEPFSDIGTEVADYAADLLDHFSTPLDPAEPTLRSEPVYLALECVVNIEWLLPLVAPDCEEAVGESQGQLGSLLRAYHTALPFSEAERAWLVDLTANDDEGNSHFAHETPTYISQQEDRIVASGVHQVVSGRDLMRRWIDWRREAEEYKDQGTLDMAREALSGLVVLLGPRVPVPESYTALRALQDQDPN
jgi:hypothetical protein